MMTQRNLKKRVDELGRLRERLGELQTAERDLSRLVREAMTASGAGLIAAGDFTALLAEQRRLHLDVRKFRRKVGEKLFLECARVDLKTARRHFGNGELEKLGEIVASMQLRVSRTSS